MATSKAIIQTQLKNSSSDIKLIHYNHVFGRIILRNSPSNYIFCEFCHYGIDLSDIKTTELYAVESLDDAIDKLSDFYKVHIGGTFDDFKERS